MASRLYLMDGSGFIFRAFHALPPLTTPSGTPIGAVIGFCNMILKLQEDKKPGYWAVIFDMPFPTFRHRLFPQYKATRPPPAPELVIQFSLIRQACQAFSIPMIEEKGVEADDIIATYTKKALEQGFDVEIVSSDKDMMQLVGQGVVFFDPLKNKIWTPEAIREKWGVDSHRITDVQALIGDKSDNIRGIPGVGPKTAAAWIQQFGSLEGLLSHIDQVQPKGKRDLLFDHQEEVRMYHTLVTLKTDAAVPLSIDQLAYRCPDHTALNTFLDTHAMKSLKARLVRMGLLVESLVPWESFSDRPFSLAVSLAKELGKIALVPVIEQGRVLGIGWSVSKDFSAFSVLDSTSLDFLLTSSSVLTILHDAKSWMHLFPDCDFVAFEDVMILSYISQGGRGSHSLEGVAAFLNLQGELDTPQKQAHALFLSYPLLKQKIQDQQEVSVYETIDKPCIRPLFLMEQIGIAVDKNRLIELGQDLSKNIEVLTSQIYKEIDSHVDIASPKQLGTFLFDGLKWPGGKKGKSGHYLTPSFVLQQLAEQGYSLAKDLLTWRHLCKLKNTYTDSLIQQIDPHTGRISTHYSMVTTSTGRLSSLNPNLQNIPIRTPEGKKIRSVFHAKPGYRLLSLDYSQIELRLLAHIADVPALKKAFSEKKDVHAAMAARIFSCAQEDVTEQMRRQAKIINFGILYGMTAMGLSKQLSLSLSEAQKYIESYFLMYPSISGYLEAAKEEAHTHGYVKTLWGRRCLIPGILSPNYIIRSAAQRQAINAPLQGSSADIMKRAIVVLSDFLKGEKARLLLHIHDEILLEVPEDSVMDLMPHLSEKMSAVAQLSIPLEVNTAHFLYWGQIEGQTLDPFLKE